MAGYSKPPQDIFFIYSRLRFYVGSGAANNTFWLWWWNSLGDRPSVKLLVALVEYIYITYEPLSTGSWWVSRADMGQDHAQMLIKVRRFPAKHLRDLHNHPYLNNTPGKIWLRHLHLKSRLNNIWINCINFVKILL